MPVKNTADDKTIYTDYRKVLERKDIDVVAIATHPGWHALISIAAMEAGKDVLCEKPMCRFIAEGRAVAEAEKRFGRIFQIGTYGRFGANRKIRKIFESGLLKQCDTVLVQRGGVKVKAWSGKVKYKVAARARQPGLGHVLRPRPAAAVPKRIASAAAPRLLGLRRRRPGRHGPPSPGRALLPVRPRRHLVPMPRCIESRPTPRRCIPNAAWSGAGVELKYADGFTLVFTSDEWGAKYDRLQAKNTGEGDIRKMLSEEDQKKLDAMPDPAPLLSFPEAVRKRKPAGGNAAASHRVATIYHLMNIAMRCGRKLRFDPVKDEVIGDEEANRLANQPMRAPWRL